MASIDQRGTYFRARVRRKGFKAKSRPFDTRSAAERWAEHTELALAAGTDTVPDLASELTFTAALEKYACEETRKKKGCDQKRRRIEAGQRHPVASLPLSERAHALRR